MIDGDSSVEKLQDVLNEEALRHSKETYFLQLELDATKRAKEATEDRMAELYRELQELNYTSEEAIENHYATAQIGKYERMLRVMNNQIHLLRTSSDTLVKSLKDEMSDLMEEKVQTELSLMNKLAELEREKTRLEKQLTTHKEVNPNENEIGDVNGCIEVALNENELEKLRCENTELKTKIESMVTKEEVDALRQRFNDSQNENQRLREQLELKDKEIKTSKERLDDETQRGKQFPTAEALQRVEEAQHKANESIDRLAVQWREIDQTVQEIGRLTDQFTRGDEKYDEESNRAVLSVLEKLGLVHAQAKASLMWTELRLKNELAHLDGSQDSSQAADSIDLESDAFRELLASVEQVEISVTREVESLKERSAKECKEIAEKYEGKMRELHSMKERQLEIEAELALLKRGQTTQESLVVADQPGTQKVELFVSQKALELLQSEVAQIVEQLQAKNATIAHMTSEIEEHRIRERTLMDELKMYRKDQAGVQQREQERLMQSFAKFEEGENCEAESDDNSEYEERTVEGTYYCEETVYEEMTVA